MSLAGNDHTARARADRRARVGVWLGTAAAGAFLLAALVPPILEARSGGGPSPLRLLFAPVCHQIEERSFVLFGGPLAVCARCTGLYLGGVLGLVGAAAVAAGGRRNMSPPWLAALVLPTLVDGVLAVLGLSPLGMVGRFALGVSAGTGLGVLLALGIHDLGLMTAGDRTRGEPAGDRRIAEEWR